jgi:hypothetical protein
MVNGVSGVSANGILSERYHLTESTLGSFSIISGIVTIYCGNGEVLSSLVVLRGAKSYNPGLSYSN